MLLTFQVNVPKGLQKCRIMAFFSQNRCFTTPKKVICSHPNILAKVVIKCICAHSLIANQSVQFVNVRALLCMCSLKLSGPL